MYLPIFLISICLHLHHAFLHGLAFFHRLQVVSTSRTPGHTKHFQTIFLTANVRLCDCPGLVFPSVVGKQLQVCFGNIWVIVKTVYVYSYRLMPLRRLEFPEFSVRKLRPCLHGPGKIFARTNTCTVPPCVYTEPAELDEFLNG